MGVHFVNKFFLVFNCASEFSQFDLAMAIRKDSPWKLLRGSRQDQSLAVEKLLRAYKRERALSEVVSLSAGYFWTRKFAEVAEFADAENKSSHYIRSTTHAIAGTARWCMGDIGGAVTRWRAGLKPDYADANGVGIEIPLLLFTASVLEPSCVEQDEILKLIETKSKDRRIMPQSWPLIPPGMSEDEIMKIFENMPVDRRRFEPPYCHHMALLLLALGRADDEVLEAACDSENQDRAFRRRCEAEFYKSVVELKATQDKSAFRQAMKKLTDTRKWNDECFTSGIRESWFHLARYEASLIRR